MRTSAEAAVPKAKCRWPSGLPRFAKTQRYVRGLYSGGTFCYEATLLLGELLGDVHSNTPTPGTTELADVWQSRQHALVDHFQAAAAPAQRIKLRLKFGH